MKQEQKENTAMNSCIIALNVGSSSLKARAYIVSDDESQLDEIDNIHYDGSDLNSTLSWIEKIAAERTVIGIGHRLVHGGPMYNQAIRLDDKAKDNIRELADFDPEHTPQALRLIEAIQTELPSVPQFASFDTAFFHDMPEIAQLLPLPRKYLNDGMRRYGFHGLSYTYLQERLTDIAGDATSQGRVIYAHLGSGSSLAATHHGTPVDTTMGFTPASGVVMSTRSGDLDPGVGLFMQKRHQINTQEFHRIVNTESGLLGVSGYTSDMKRLLDDELINPQAAKAVELFCYRVAQSIGALTTTIGGLDTLVFSGGIGEQSAVLRQRITDKLAFFGVQLDNTSNQHHDQVISVEASETKVYVIPTDEMYIIARDAKRITRKGEA